jgi:hypothetical protein
MKDPLKIVVLFAATLVVGCSDPEAEANKLFTEASQLVKEADAIDDSNPDEAYNKRKAAVELIEKIPVQYPSSIISGKISSGEYELSSHSRIEIYNKIYEGKFTVQTQPHYSSIDYLELNLKKDNTCEFIGFEKKGEMYNRVIAYLGKWSIKDDILICSYDANLEVKVDITNSKVLSLADKHIDPFKPFYVSDKEGVDEIFLNKIFVPDKLSKCFTCRGKVSPNAKVCPHCGEPDPAKN